MANFMNNFLCKWQPADFIALILILGGMFLKYCGADGVISILLVSIAFYYFGKKGNPIFDKINDILPITKQTNR